jgi:transposase
MLAGMELTQIISSAPPPLTATGPTKHAVRLADPDRAVLRKLTRTGVAAARALAHARILLQSDVAPGGPGWTDEQIRAALGVSLATIARVRRAFATRGLDAALHRRPAARTRRRTLDGEQEAHLVALSCSAPPDGWERWTLRLLADRFVQLEAGVPVSYETVHRVLKKTRSSRG